MTIKEEASNILGIRIEDWDKSIDNIDRAGMFGRKQHMKLLIMLLKRMEKIEDDKQQV